MGILISPQDYAPSWSPNWDDVNYDHDQSDALVTALKALWTSIDTATSERAQQAQLVNSLPPRLSAEWSGNYATQWGTMAQKNATDAATLHRRIEATITSLNNASRKAATEQATRVSARKRWTTEYDAGMARMQKDVARMRAEGMSVTVQ